MDRRVRESGSEWGRDNKCAVKNVNQTEGIFQLQLRWTLLVGKKKKALYKYYIWLCNSAFFAKWREMN